MSDLQDRLIAYAEALQKYGDERTMEAALVKEAADALDAKDAEIGRLREQDQADGQ